MLFVNDDVFDIISDELLESTVEIDDIYKAEVHNKDDLEHYARVKLQRRSNKSVISIPMYPNDPTFDQCKNNIMRGLEDQDISTELTGKSRRDAIELATGFCVYARKEILDVYEDDNPTTKQALEYKADEFRSKIDRRHSNIKKVATAAWEERHPK